MLYGQLHFAALPAIELQLTQHWYERLAGLLALAPLKTGQGLLIKPCNSVHSFGMNYDLDLVYLDRELQIIKLVEGLKRNRLSACWRAHAVLELPAGSIAQMHLSLGQAAVWQENK